MQDYVYCAECGMMIDSDHSVTSKDDEGGMLFFCSERHKLQWHEQNNNKGLYDND